MLVRILIGAGLFVLGYTLGRARRPTVVLSGQPHTNRISDVVASQNRQAGTMQSGEGAAQYSTDNNTSTH